MSLIVTWIRFDIERRLRSDISPVWHVLAAITGYQIDITAPISSYQKC